MSKKIISSFSGEYDFLSNFYLYPITYEGKPYPTVEHAYQASKTSFPTAREVIRLARTPGQAKRLGREVPLRSGWEDLKLTIMLILLRKKFRDHFLSQRLIATGDAILIEGNNWGDRFWGAELVDTDWVGENKLGELLMQVRREVSAGM